MSGVHYTSTFSLRFNTPPSDLTPEIAFDGETGVLRLAGKSLPENPMEFYAPMLDWVRQYVELPAERTVFLVCLQYYNTSTSKVLFSVLRYLERLLREGKRVEVEWHYGLGDEEMEEAGRDFSSVTPIRFSYVQDNANGL